MCKKRPMNIESYKRNLHTYGQRHIKETYQLFAHTSAARCSVWKRPMYMERDLQKRPIHMKGDLTKRPTDSLLTPRSKKQCIKQTYVYGKRPTKETHSNEKRPIKETTYKKELSKTPTGWRRLIGCLKLQVICHKRGANYRALLQKMTCRIRHPMTLCHPVLAHVCIEAHEHHDARVKVESGL